ncbi:HCLS1-binding protein 3-like [Strongylocentrotus purpuratus]|uniref:PX domain-containing protein n=1 Tax=Strongylocentrotus purpuratus TaxID=7668 RepID=A0A7M7N300_STRPU|nr:HCLS1-binding protein 3-like [Strongylocentrotus purpuratus]
MNKAIVTPRTLKNTETGIDITVPEFRTITKLLSNQEEFHVIVISSLPYFKSPDHKPEDVVQFMVPKWYSDFESLHKAMSDRYPATIFPDLPKKVLMVRDSTPQGRRSAFEKLMQFIAASPKVCCSPILLEFLGVPSSKIGAVEGQEKESESRGSGDGTQKDDMKSPTKSVKSQSSSLFGEEDSDDELFKTEKGDVDEADSDLFSPSPRHAPPSTKGE